MNHFFPRADRDLARGRRAAAACKAAGGSAIQCIEASIDATFNGSSAHNRIKRNIDLLIRKGPSSDHARAYYSTLARRIAGMTLDEAIETVTVWYRAKRPPSRKWLLTNVTELHADAGRSLHAERIYGALVLLRLMRAKKVSDAMFRAICERVNESELTLMAAE